MRALMEMGSRLTKSLICRKDDEFVNIALSTDWAQGEPNVDTGVMNCVVRDPDGMLHARLCESVLHATICEITMDATTTLTPQPSTTGKMRRYGSKISIKQHSQSRNVLVLYANLCKRA